MANKHLWTKMNLCGRRKRTLKKCTVIDDPAAAVVATVDPPLPQPPCPDFDAIDAAEAAVARATEAVLRANGDVGRNFLVDDPPDLLMYHHGYGGGLDPSPARLRRPNVRAYSGESTTSADTCSTTAAAAVTPMQTPHIRRAPNSALRSGSVTRWLNAAAAGAGSSPGAEKRSGGGKKGRSGGGGKMYGVVKKATQTRAGKTERSGLPKCRCKLPKCSLPSCKLAAITCNDQGAV